MSFLIKTSRLVTQKIGPHKLGVVCESAFLKRLPVIPVNQQIRFETCQPSGKSKKEETSIRAPYYESLHKKQKLFQEKNDVPIYLKGGGTDKFLYQLTIWLTAIGLLLTLKTWVYDLSYAKTKKKE